MRYLSGNSDHSAVHCLVVSRMLTAHIMVRETSSISWIGDCGRGRRWVVKTLLPYSNKSENFAHVIYGCRLRMTSSQGIGGIKYSRGIIIYDGGIAWLLAPLTPPPHRIYPRLILFRSIARLCPFILQADTIRNELARDNKRSFILSFGVI